MALSSGSVSVRLTEEEEEGGVSECESIISVDVNLREVTRWVIPSFQYEHEDIM